MSLFYAAFALAALVYLAIKLVQHARRQSRTNSFAADKPATQEDPLPAYRNIEPLVDFDWKTTEPIKLRPFKPKYHLTMALETIPLSDLLLMDNTYLSRITLRRNLMATHPQATLACNAVAESAALELYAWLVETYLPRRFPTCFALVDEEGAATAASEPGTGTASHLFNKITAESISLTPASPLTALQTLGSHIDTDFLILLPRPTERSEKPQPNQPSTTPTDPTQPTYHLEAYNTTFPSGFSTRSKLSLPLSAIHSPVPAYAPKLSRSMDRFFARLEPGRLVSRANWTVTGTAELFAESGTHDHSTSGETGRLSDEEREAEIAAQRAQLRVEEMRLRCERQTLFRLPVSGALVFSFKTYQYGLAEVKADGSGEALADATEGFGRGSVPEMEVYKRAAVWGEVVRGYMRG